MKTLMMKKIMKKKTKRGEISKQTLTNLQVL